jgi:hypothetical protein
MDSSSITAAVVSFNSTIGLLNTLYKVTQDEKVRERVFEIQTALLSLQEQQFAANARYEEKCKETTDLQRQLDERDAWDEKEKKYELFQMAEGMTVYKLRADCNPTGGEILACPNCFRNREISFLYHSSVGNLNYVCPACPFKILPVSVQMAWGGERRLF